MTTKLTKAKREMVATLENFAQELVTNKFVRTN
jgi:hypothetical protein